MRFGATALEHQGINGSSMPTEPKKDPGVGDVPFKPDIVWINALGFLFMHLMALYGVWLSVFNASYYTTVWALIMSFASGEGITIGAHRLYTHRSFKATWPLRFALIILQTIAGQNCMYIWVRDHRQHHKYSDTDADPHNARRGFFFSHIGWLMMKKRPEVKEKGKTIDMSDLEKDSLVMFQKKYYKPLYVIFAIVIPVAVPVLMWNETLWNSLMISYFSRYVLLLNVTWSVNSAAHMFGTRPYDKSLVPVESEFVSFVGFGEGWHNYHHCFPWDYRASEYGKHFNGTTYIINFFERCGLAYDLKYATPSLVKNRALRTGDGSHPLWGFGDKDMDKETLAELCRKGKEYPESINEVKNYSTEEKYTNKICESVKILPDKLEKVTNSNRATDIRSVTNYADNEEDVCDLEVSKLTYQEAETIKILARKSARKHKNSRMNKNVNGDINLDLNKTETPIQYSEYPREAKLNKEDKEKSSFRSPQKS